MTEKQKLDFFGNDYTVLVETTNKKYKEKVRAMNDVQAIDMIMAKYKDKKVLDIKVV